MKTQWYDERNAKKRNNHNDYSSFYLVIRMGLEPMTPTLKVLCSTS